MHLRKQFPLFLLQSFVKVFIIVTYVEMSLVYLPGIILTKVI